MKHALSLYAVTCAILLLLCSHAHAQTSPVLKTPGTNALLEPVSTGSQSLTISASGTLVLTSGCTITGSGTIPDANIASAAVWNAKQPALTFGTGLTNASGTVSVNTTQNITQLTNLTTVGVVTTTNNSGVLAVVAQSSGGVGTSDQGKIVQFSTAGSLQATSSILVAATSGSGYSVYTPTALTWYHVGGSAYNLALTLPTLTATRSIAWPNNSGTVALTSDLNNITQLSSLTTNGFVKTSGSNGTLSVDTNTYLTANQSITLSGDVTGSGTTAITSTLANSGASAGTYGSATQSLTASVDAKGRVTSISAQTVTPAESSITFTDITTGNASTSMHGFLPKLDGGVTHFLNGAGSFVGISALTGLTDLGISLANNTALTGFSLGTITDTTSRPFMVSQTWNNSSLSATAFNINVTTTSSAGTGKLFSVSVGGTPVFYISENQTFTAVASGSFGANITVAGTVQATGGELTLGNNTYSIKHGSSALTQFYHDGSYFEFVRNGTNAQRFDFANTWTSSTNYESFSIDWQTAPNVCILNTAKGSSGGTPRNMSLRIGGAEKVIVNGTGMAVGTTGTPHSKIKSGTATLVAGTVTVSDSDVVDTGTASTSSRILVTRMNDGGTVGDSYSITRSNGASFTITAKYNGSTQTADTSTVSYLILNP